MDADVIEKPATILLASDSVVIDKETDHAMTTKIGDR